MVVVVVVAVVASCFCVPCTISEQFTHQASLGNFS